MGNTKAAEAPAREGRPAGPADADDGPEPGLRGRGTAALGALRARSTLFDRLVRSARAYTKGGGDREAAALAYYGFLAVFPFVVVALSVLGFVIRDADLLRAEVIRAVERLIPGSATFLSNFMDTIAEQAAIIGAAGLAGLAWSGLGAVDVLRGALDRVFGVEKVGGIKGKVRNLRFMIISGLLLAASIALGSLAAGGVAAGLDLMGVEGSGVKTGATATALALAFGTDLALFTVLFMQLPDHDLGWRDVRWGAVMAATGWLLLKTVGGWLVAWAAARSSARYGVAAAVFGLLLTINLASRLTIFSAEWAAAGRRPKRT